MKVKLRKMVLAILCICVTLSAIAVIPTKAADHICKEATQPAKKEGPQSYRNKNILCHETKYSGTFTCETCNNVMSVRDIYIEEGHKYTRYESLGHSGIMHNYRITCGLCGGSRDITIDCSYNGSGSHTTPF